MKLWVVFIFLGAFELCKTERILYLIPVPSKSHYILSEPLVEELVRKDHEVTIVAPFKRLKPLENVNEIVILDVGESLINETDPSKTSEEKLAIRQRIPSLYSTDEGSEVLVEKIMTYKSVLDLLDSDQKFDLVIGHCLSMEGLLAGFSYRFDAPMAFVSSSMPDTYLNEMVGNPAPSSYIPEPSLNYNDKMTFYQRFVNFLYTIIIQIKYYMFHLPRQDNMMKKYFGEEIPHLKTLLQNNSIVLVNDHHSLSFPRPYLPTIIDIGGYHIKATKGLPKDLQTFMDEAQDGVIYINMGSYITSSKFPNKTIEAISKALSHCSQKVLWKLEKESLMNEPDNVKISKWLPQSDILVHPNTKLFITHGGLLTLTESIFRGVPMIGISVFPDQMKNVKQIENLEVGVALELDHINEEILSEAIQQVLNDPKYAEHARFRSQILRDRPLPPLDTAVYWLEYIMRYKGVSHLKSGAQRLAWYQLYLLDVFALLGVILLLGIFISSKLCYWFLKILREATEKGMPIFKKTN